MSKKLFCAYSEKCLPHWFVSMASMCMQRLLGVVLGCCLVRLRMLRIQLTVFYIQLKIIGDGFVFAMLVTNQLQSAD